MPFFYEGLEIIGTVSFAVSGALAGLKKQLDLFGILMLGVLTAVGGGILRDMLLGMTPPAALSDPRNALIAAGVSLFICLPPIRRLWQHHRLPDFMLLLCDSIGLGLFTVQGIKTALDAGFREQPFLVLVAAVLTGVGGGVLRDSLTGGCPAIFVKHIYACASLAGAALCLLLQLAIPLSAAMAFGSGIVVVLRLLSARFCWDLPRFRTADRPE